MRQGIYVFFCVVSLGAQSLKSIHNYEFLKTDPTTDSVLWRFQRSVPLTDFNTAIEPAPGFTPLILLEANVWRLSAFYLISNPLVIDQKTFFPESNLLSSSTFFPRFLNNPFSAGGIEYGITNRLSVGAIGGIKFEIDKNTTIDKTKPISTESVNYYAAVYGHYNMPIEALFYFMTTLRFPFQYGKFLTDNTSVFNEFNYTSYGAELELGMAFKVFTVRFAYLYLGIFSLAYRINETNSVAYIPNVVNLDSSVIEDIQASNFSNTSTKMKATLLPKIGIVFLVNDANTFNNRRR
jgi:hypothetical protein